MANGDFFSDQFDEAGSRQEYESALELFKQSCDEGTEQNLRFSEDEFIYIIDYYINLDDEQMVLKASELAFSQHSYSSELLIRLVDTLMVGGNVNQALSMLEEYKDSFPQNIDIMLLNAKANIKISNFDEAKSIVMQVLANEQASPELAESVAALAQDCIDAGNFDDALKYLLQANGMSALPVEYSSDIAFCYERLDNMEKAVYYYNKYLDSDPFNDNVWFNLGTIYAKQLQFEKSIEAFEYSLALNGNNSSSLYNLAVVYLNLDRFKESAETFVKFNECDDDNLSGIIGLANAQLGMNDFKGACESFRRAYYLDNNCLEAMLGLTAVLAIMDYNEGNRASFFIKLEEIMRKDATWIGTIYKVMPQLIADKEFMNFVEKVKKN